MKKIIVGIFVCLLLICARADEFDDVLADENINFDDYYIETPDTGDMECSLDTMSLNAGATVLPVADFDIAGIMLGMDFDEVKFIAAVDGLYTERPKNSVVYSIHPDWKYNLDYECRQQKIYAPAALEKCINSLARNRGVLYASELHLVRDVTGETIDVFFTSNATDNVVWKIVYRNDTDEIEGDAEKFENQRDKKTMYWWQNVVDKYGAPNAGNSRWASSDNSFDPMMTAYSGELELIDCGKHTEDGALNAQHSQDNFAAKPYAF
ncbi:MAG: hypothetical protein II179_00425 [Alphaproteobacteria bacterium]|nr:hypothetical protein [Alphaproteobacteria bacterium]